MHTNETTHFQLPIFVANDTPAWLVDWNGAMNDIDSALYSIQQGSGTIATDLATVQTNLTTLEGIVESQGTSISSLASALTSAQGTINTITSLIGNGEPTTTDKTIIGAINEINADVSQLNSDLTERGSLTTLATETSVQSKNVIQKTVADISDFKYVCISTFITGTGDRMNPLIVPVSLFKNIKQFYCSSYSDTTVSGAKYVNDTTVEVYCYSSEAVGYASMFVAGIK